MNCEYSEKILLYFYGETDNAQSKEIKNHLKTCSECKKNLEVLSGISKYLNTVKAEPPSHLIDGIIREARENNPAVSFVAPRFSAAKYWRGKLCERLENIFIHWKKTASALVFAALIIGIFFNFGIDKNNFKWISDIDSELDSLEYSMYEAQNSFLGGYAESVEDFEYENIDAEIESISENRRIL
ncbi:MAG: hypothetical protein L6420_10990 [Elusimicrobia bacterium]|nr:hypothetical protein [Elusimicrobiota bacterium]